MRDMGKFVFIGLLLLYWLPWIQGEWAEDDFVGSGDDDGSGQLLPYSSHTTSTSEIINIETVSVVDTISDTGLLMPMTSSTESLPIVTSSLQDAPTVTPTSSTSVPILVSTTISSSSQTPSSVATPIPESTSPVIVTSMTTSTMVTPTSVTTSSIMGTSSPPGTPVTTPTPAFTSSIMTTPTPVSSVPEVTVVILNATAMEVSWNVIPSVSGYVIILTEVERGRNRRQNNVIEIEITGGHVTNRIIAGLKPYTQYSVQVAIIDANGNRGQLSPTSIEATEEGIPGPPANVSWTTEDDNIRITWLPPLEPNGNVTHYIVTVTTADGSQTRYNVSADELSVLVSRPSERFSVSVLAVNGAGMGESGPGMTAPTESEGDSQEEGAATVGVVVGVVVFVVLLIIVVVLVMVGVLLWWRYQYMTGGMEVDVGGEMVFKSSNTDLSKVENALEEGDSQLTAKRWMRANANYSTSAVLLPSISDLVSRYSTAEDVVDTKTIVRPILEPILEQSMQEPVIESNQSSSERTPDTPSTMSSVCSKTHFEVNKIVPLLEPGAVARPLESPQEETDQPPKAFEDYAVDVQEVEVAEQMGVGEHSKVMKGTFSSTGTVAIKILNEDSNSTSETEFIESARIMSQFLHENVVKLIGTCLLGPPPLMILMTCMSLGDLKKYLTRVRRRTRLENMSCEFGLKEQLKISIQIASGMNYLSSQSYVHRALQAKYILLGEDHCVRIGGFTMSQALSDPKRYKEIKKANKLPVKWLALETLNSGKFTTQSDVWSFGVVLWELFAFGLTPYRGVQNEDVIKQLVAGRRLIKPSDCPGDVFTLMLHCWNEKPQERPTFSSLYNHLSMMSESLIRERERQNVPSTLRDLFQDPVSPTTNNVPEPHPPLSSSSPLPLAPQAPAVTVRRPLEQQLSNESTKLVRGSATLSAIELALSQFDNILSDDSTSQVEEAEPQQQAPTPQQRAPTPDLCSGKPQKQTIDESDSRRDEQTYTKL